MKTSTIIIVLTAVAVFAGIFALGYVGKGSTTASVQGAAEASAPKSQLTATETLHDFGAISMKNGDVQYDFIVTNSTDTDITMFSLVTSCMCTAAYLIEADGSSKGPFGMSGMDYVPPVNEIIKAGESRTVRVVYDPNAHGPAGVGQIDRFVTFTDASGGVLQIEIKALVTP